jgi:L-ascorbate metabolism protein UlaG (beta-lactamase superfamily)
LGRNTVYRFEIDGVTIVHLGDLGQALNSHDIEQLGTVDVLLVPVGGCYTIDAKTAKALIDEIEPSIVIPMHYKTAEHAEKQFADVAPLEDFLKQYGITDIVKQPKVSVVKDKLPETTQVVVLSS